MGGIARAGGGGGGEYRTEAAKRKGRRKHYLTLPVGMLFFKAIIGTLHRVILTFVELFCVDSSIG